MAISTALMGGADEYTGSNHSSSPVFTVGAVHAAAHDSIVLTGMFVRSTTDTPTITAVDSQGNTYNLVTPYGHGAGASTVGAFILVAHDVVALTTSDTITLTVNSCNGSSFSASTVSWGVGNTGQTDASAGANSAGSSSLSSGASGSVASAQEAIFGALGAFNTGHDITVGAGWTSIELRNPSPAFPLRSEQQIQDGTASGTYTATGTATGTEINGAAAVATFLLVAGGVSGSIGVIAADAALSLDAESFVASVAVVAAAPVLSLTGGEELDAALALIAAQATLAMEASQPGEASLYLAAAPASLGIGAALQPYGALQLIAPPATVALAVNEPPAAAVHLVAPPANVTMLARVRFPHVGPLAVTSVTPNYGGGLTAVVIRGTGFLGTVAVKFGTFDSYGYPGILPVVIDDTELHVFAPPGPHYLAIGDFDDLTVDVVVFTLDGPDLGSPVTPADEYTFIAPPVLYSVLPIFGNDQADTPVVVYGKNLQWPIIAVNLGGFFADGGDWIGTADGSSATGTLLTANFKGRFNDAYPVEVHNAAGASGPNNPTFTVYPGPQPVIPSPTALDDALSGRYGPVAIRYRFEQRDRAFNFIADLTPAVAEEGEATSGDLGGGGGGGLCTIHHNNEQPVPATVDLTFGLPELLPASFDAGHPETYNVAVWADIDVPGTGTVSLCRGLFHLDLPVEVQYANGDDDALSTMLVAKGAEMAYLLADRTTPVAYVVPAGSVYTQVVGAICRTFGLQEEISTIIGANYVTPVDIPFQAGATWLEICNALLWGINYYPLQATARGVITSRRRQDPASETAVVVYRTDGEPRMLVPPTTRTPYVGSFNNQISVAIDDPTRIATPAVRTNADPASPLSTVVSGKLNFKAYTGTSSPSTKAVFNETMAAVIAEFEVRDEACKAVQREIEIVPDPRRYGREWVLLTIQGREELTLWRIVSQDYTCSPQGPHRLLVELAEELTVT